MTPSWSIRSICQPPFDARTRKKRWTKAGAPGAPSGGLPIGVILGIGVFGLVILAGLVYIATVVFGE